VLFGIPKRSDRRERQTNYAGGIFTDAVHGADGQGFYKINVQIAP
jgi:hypothetical protein